MISILAAEYTNKSKHEPAWLTLNRIENGRRSFVLQIGVSGKVEARRVAKQHGAQPWNF